ncbi:hypothetical protein CNEO4_950006 [Clostridium neonatale]|uniref:Uncharacterized protein n=1 Tax=Clostridium neonatale TaxID=137838 RepID=A0AA86JKB4_9CLOT|nr:hypothetical protein CNEO_42699 [Clostridium neonatale]CAG9709405.1 hypothetical protein CNEO_140004 [Clostridium neonatale]CAG9713888.1 hypothetical protein CNEO_610005 [Clostridium neonatale]CAI3199562.1 hypothetical protein CNEO2_230079 [Clostridium neonatale]CAI3544972.1 hypothetical protein CNEO2_140091 [Clostridium neonatale]
MNNMVVFYRHINYKKVYIKKHKKTLLSNTNIKNKKGEFI